MENRSSNVAADHRLSSSISFELANCVSLEKAVHVVHRASREDPRGLATCLSTLSSAPRYPAFKVVGIPSKVRQNCPASTWGTWGRFPNLPGAAHDSAG